MAPDSEFPAFPVSADRDGSALDDPRGHRTHPVTGIVQGLLIAFALVVGFGSQVLNNGDADSVTSHPLLAVGILAGAAALGVLIGFVRWLFWRWALDPTEVRIESGLLWKTSRRVPFARVQSVDISQPLIARLLGLSEVRIESAGGGNSVTRVRFLEKAEAEAVRYTILERSGRLPSHPARAPGAAGDIPAPPGAIPPPPGAIPPPPGAIPPPPGAIPPPPGAPIGLPGYGPVAGRALVAEVSPGRLILGALVSLDLLLPVLGAVVFVGVSIWLGEAALLFGSAFSLYLGVVQSVSRRIVSQWGFRLTRGDDGLRIERGLLSRTSQTIPLDRIQGVRIEEPAIWRRLGWQRLEVDVAGYGAPSSENGVSSSTLLPVGTRALAATVLAQVVPGIDPATSQRVRVTRRSWIFAPIGWRFRWIGDGGAGVVSQTGWMSRSTNLVPHARVQSLDLRQGPLQRLRRVATVRPHSPDGPVDAMAEHLNADDALDVLLAQMARSQAAR